jgi:hypothetical protein
MECKNEVIKKILVVSCKKYNLFGFRFGPLTYIKIEVTYHNCGKFTCDIIEGIKIKNFQKLFSKEIDRTIKEIIKELTFIIRRKNIIKELSKKKSEPHIKVKSPDEKIKITRDSFDELTTRMRKAKSKLGIHDCVKKDIVVKNTDLEKEFENYFGDTSKIFNRRTKKD